MNERVRTIEDFVHWVEEYSKEANIHPIRVENIIKDFLDHCPTGSH